MTTPGHAALRQLALRALERRAGSADGAEALAAAARRAYDDLALVSAPLIGDVGVEALTGRALHLAQREYPWLLPTDEKESADKPFAHIVRCLEQQEPAVAAEAAGTVFAVLMGLLVTFIGDPLTQGLLQQAWPDAFAEASTEET